jgi:hypothetical protein
MNFDDFGVGKVKNNASALVRPFRILVDEGKPIGRINYVFYRSMKSYVLGALCLATSQRLLFFPAGRIALDE